MTRRRRRAESDDSAGRVMPHQVDRRTMEKWLIDHGFELQPGRKTSHRQFVRDGVKITLPGHGPADLTKKHVAMIVRQLEAAGFDRDTVRRELDA